jgi:hypothetical protein
MLRKCQDELLELRQRTAEQPYSIVHRLKLAKAYQVLGYPDLAAGDAYKALILVDEVREEGEYHEAAVEAAVADLKVDFECVHGCSCKSPSDAARTNGTITVEAKVVQRATQCWSKTAYVLNRPLWVGLTQCRYDVFIPCLLECGCLRTAFDYSARSLKAFPESDSFKGYRQSILGRLRSHFESQGESLDEAMVQDYPDKGTVRRELYPWNEYEPDRFSPEVLQVLNDQCESVAPKLVVKVTELPLLKFVFPRNPVASTNMKQ